MHRAVRGSSANLPTTDVGEGGLLFSVSEWAARASYKL